VSEGSERIVYSGTVTSTGQIDPDAVNATAGRLAKWKGRHVTVTVSRFVKSKTNPQLALYFGPVIEAWSDYTGYPPDEMDRELRKAYLKPQLEMAQLTGEETMERPRISSLNVEQMTAYLDRVLMEGRLNGITFKVDQ
jgi:hypothetical protein